MSKMLPSVLALGAALLFLGLPACSGKVRQDAQDPAAFNDAITGTIGKLNASGQQFGQAIRAAIQDDRPENVAQVKKAQAEVAHTLAAIKLEMKAVQVPPSPGARELFAVHQRFLNDEEQTVQTHFTDVVRIVEDPTLDRQTKADRIGAILDRAGKTEQEDLDELARAQKVFAEEYHIRLQ